MTKEEWEQKFQDDLAAIQIDVSDGQIDEAANKLCAIALNNPPGSNLSKEIGDLYLELGFPVMAGRYWYLLDNKSDQMLAACDEFQQSLGNNPVFILQSIDRLLNAPPELEQKLKELRCLADDFQRQYQSKSESPNSILTLIMPIGCGIVMSIMWVVFIVGIISIVHWFR